MGYFATCGPAPEMDQGEVHCRGTYVAGRYNRLLTVVGDEHMENQSLVNLPNWLGLRVRLPRAEWVDLAACE
jgi:alpha,alpha-trehalase